MRIIVGKKSYIEIKKDKKTGDSKLSIKTRKDDSTSIIISAPLNDEVIDKLITELVKIKSGV